MFRYRMSSKPSRFGWVVAVFVIGILLVILAGQLGSGQQAVANQPASTENGGALLRLWDNVGTGLGILWDRLVGADRAEQVDVDLGSQGDSGYGTDEEDTPADDDITVEIAKPLAPDAFVPLGQSPQVLVYHTHTHESYTKQEGQNYVEVAKWRTDDNAWNVVRVGEALAMTLSARYGIATLHNKTDTEYPKLGTSYSRSLKTVQKDLEENRDLRILIDLHRDAFSAGIDPPALTINGKKVARIMLVIGTGEGQTGVGFTLRPDWKKNLALAQAITDRLNQFDPQLARRISIKKGRYNQHLSTGAILIEVGHNQNTLEEAMNAVPFLAEAIAGAYRDLGDTAGPVGTLSPTALPPTTQPAIPAATVLPSAPVTTPIPSPSPSVSASAPQVITIDPDETQRPRWEE